MKQIDLMLLRKSRSDNSKETVEETLARHEAQLQELALKQTGKHIPEENIYREVVSGGEDIKLRPDFLRLLRRLENKDIRQVYCMDPERLSRSGMYGAGEVLRIFEVTDTLIATYDQTYNLKNQMDKKYLEMRMIQSADYRNYSKDVMNRGRKRSVREGYFVGSTPPYGYKKKQLPDEKNRFILEPNEEEAPAVQLMFEKIIEGIGTTNLAHLLNELKYKPRKSKNWSAAMVRNILISKVYCGYNTWEKYKVVEEVINGEVVKKRRLNPDYLECKGRQDPLISEETYNKVQEILKSHPSSNRVTKSNEISNPLAGIIICKKCNRHMIKRPYTDKHLINGKRKYKYDRQELLTFLRNAKSKSGLSLTQIAKKMKLTKDIVYGWFPPRIEKFYDGVSLATRWYELKEVLDIKETKYDKAITTYEKKTRQKDSLICITPYCDNVSSELEIVEARLIEALEITLNEINYYLGNYEEVIKKETKNNEKTLIRIEKEINKYKRLMEKSRDNFNAGIYTSEEFLNDKTRYQKEINELEDIKLKLLTNNDKEKMDKVQQYNKAVPILTNCIKSYWTLDIAGRNELLKDLLIKVEYEKNEGGRWNKEAIDKFALTPHIKLITKNKSLI